jgi:hypothetical protein
MHEHTNSNNTHETVDKLATKVNVRRPKTTFIQCRGHLLRYNEHIVVIGKLQCSTAILIVMIVR